MKVKVLIERLIAKKGYVLKYDPTGEIKGKSTIVILSKTNVSDFSEIKETSAVTVNVSSNTEEGFIKPSNVTDLSSSVGVDSEYVMELVNSLSSGDKILLSEEDAFQLKGELVLPVNVDWEENYIVRK